MPGADNASALFAHSPAAEFRTGAAGITLPAVRRTPHFSDSQVVTALTTAKDYLVESSLDPEVLSGGTDRPVRLLLEPQQLDQFDRSIGHPAADGRHAPTGWLVRFDPPARTRRPGDPCPGHPAPPRPARRPWRSVPTTPSSTPCGRLAWTSHGKASLFTIRRQMDFRFGRDDLRLHQADVVGAYEQAGPLACSADSADRLRPLLAGQKAKAGGPRRHRPVRHGPRRGTVRHAVAERATEAVDRLRHRWRPRYRSTARSTPANTAPHRPHPPSGAPESAEAHGSRGGPGRTVRTRPRRTARPCRRPREDPEPPNRTRPPRSPAPPAISVTSFINGSLELRISLA